MKRVDRRIVWASTLVLCLAGVAFAEEPAPKKTDPPPAEANKDAAPTEAGAQAGAEAAEQPMLSWTAHEESKPVPEGAGGSIILRAVRAPQPIPGEEVQVFTNADLERMDANLTPMQRLQGVYQAKRHIGRPAPAGTETPAEASEGGSPEGAPPVESGTAGQSVRNLRARVAELERELLAARNPLLSRRVTDPDSDSPDDAGQAEDPASNVERVQRIEEELRSTREALRQAEERSGAEPTPSAPDGADAP